MSDLKSLAERIHNVMDERDSLAEDLREIFSEAKAKGFEPPILRRVIAEQRRRNKSPFEYDEAQEISDLYKAAIEGGPDPVSARLSAAAGLFAKGLTVQEVANALGVGNGTAGRLRQMAVARVLFIPSQENERDGTGETVDPETGEVLADEPQLYPGAPGAEIAVEPLPRKLAPPAPVIGDDFPDLPPFMDRRGAMQ